MTRRGLGRGALAGVLTAITGLPVCNLIFRCGCAWMFAGGADHCNMHVPGPPDCPVCTSGPVGALFVVSLFGLWMTALSLLRGNPKGAPD